MSTHTEAHSQNAESHSHHGGPKIYTANLFALLFLTIITVAAASFNFGSANVVIALAIATVKATLVALFFMHLRYSRPLMLMVVAAGLLWLGIMITLTLGDFLTRGWLTYR